MFREFAFPYGKSPKTQFSRIARLKPGANEIRIFSTFKGHGLEINWPGPVLLVKFAR